MDIQNEVNPPKYHLELERGRAFPRTVVVKVVTHTDADDTHFRWRDNAPLDARFDLASMIGNDNGQFKWGQSAFGMSSRNITVTQDGATQANYLNGELLDLFGNWQKSRINLDEKLTINEYVDQGTGETYHRLMINKSTLNKADKRKLVLCFDGTAGKFSGTQNTNVVKLVELLKKDDPSQQMIYYQTGIGTYGPPGRTASIGLTIAKGADKAFAWYLDQHVMDGYRFLVQSYKAGDSISLFGFSRGAFTARALAGMLHCVGLLPRHNIEQIPFAYEIYQNAKDAHHPEYKEFEGRDATTYAHNEVNPREFKSTFCFDVKVDFVGAWDTVASVGFFWSRTLPWVDYNPSIRVFRQALSLDERRVHFIPSVWDHGKTKQLKPEGGDQSIYEVWFRGEHSDIGGVAPQPHSADEAPRKSGILGNIPLRWMIRQTINCQTGILFDYRVIEKYREAGILERPGDISPPKLMWQNRIKASNKLDEEDIKGEICDSFESWPLWYIAELKRLTMPRPTLNRGRVISFADEKVPIFLHSSVVNYMDRQSQTPSNSGSVGTVTATTEEYRPKARFIGANKEKGPQVEDAYYEASEHRDEGLPPKVKAKINIEPAPPPVQDVQQSNDDQDKLPSTFAFD